MRGREDDKGEDGGGEGGREGGRVIEESKGEREGG